uniref:Uncharacterized protein n=1 Tax=Chromera velia CCMP2878 TaxID=1169474 RepID=A0A0G4FDC6_9ALVE|eukprot:Cvel_16363.t1-p1 / transcript=Cvel_16363.t1 / gene=Cvel_16363 / organism=Chromera_velia_CCMP2878 / gene_product=hypothetical protein / transcript_product=hypothetical protein / location=Cvel_scaffold1257:10926-30618(-) / protein_length=1310 / sequence_SO=supercontig / SO=protein_coding / is_pseudo=false
MVHQDVISYSDVLGYVLEGADISDDEVLSSPPASSSSSSSLSLPSLPDPPLDFPPVLFTLGSAPGRRKKRKPSHVPNPIATETLKSKPPSKKVGRDGGGAKKTQKDMKGNKKGKTHFASTAAVQSQAIPNATFTGQPPIAESHEASSSSHHGHTLKQKSSSSYSSSSNLSLSFENKQKGSGSPAAPLKDKKGLEDRRGNSESSLTNVSPLHSFLRDPQVLLCQVPEERRKDRDKDRPTQPAACPVEPNGGSIAATGNTKTMRSSDGLVEKGRQTGSFAGRQGAKGGGSSSSSSSSSSCQPVASAPLKENEKNGREGPDSDEEEEEEEDTCPKSPESIRMELTLVWPSKKKGEGAPTEASSTDREGGQSDPTSEEKGEDQKRRDSESHGKTFAKETKADSKAASEKMENTVSESSEVEKGEAIRERKEERENPPQSSQPTPSLSSSRNHQTVLPHTSKETPANLHPPGPPTKGQTKPDGEEKPQKEQEEITTQFHATTHHVEERKSPQPASDTPFTSSSDKTHPNKPARPSPPPLSSPLPPDSGLSVSPQEDNPTQQPSSSTRTAVVVNTGAAQSAASSLFSPRIRDFMRTVAAQPSDGLPTERSRSQMSAEEEKEEAEESPPIKRNTIHRVSVPEYIPPGCTAAAENQSSFQPTNTTMPTDAVQDQDNCTPEPSPSAHPPSHCSSDQEKNRRAALPPFADSKKLADFVRATVADALKGGGQSQSQSQLEETDPGPTGECAEKELNPVSSSSASSSVVEPTKLSSKEKQAEGAANEVASQIIQALQCMPVEERKVASEKVARALCSILPGSLGPSNPSPEASAPSAPSGSNPPMESEEGSGGGETQKLGDKTSATRTGKAEKELQGKPEGAPAGLSKTKRGGGQQCQPFVFAHSSRRGRMHKAGADGSSVQALDKAKGAGGRSSVFCLWDIFSCGAPGSSAVGGLRQQTEARGGAEGSRDAPPQNHWGAGILRETLNVYAAFCQAMAPAALEDLQTVSWSGSLRGREGGREGGKHNLGKKGGPEWRKKVPQAQQQSSSPTDTQKTTGASSLKEAVNLTLSQAGRAPLGESSSSPNSKALSSSALQKARVARALLSLSCGSNSAGHTDGGRIEASAGGKADGTRKRGDTLRGNDPNGEKVSASLFHSFVLASSSAATEAQRTGNALLLDRRSEEYSRVESLETRGTEERLLQEHEKDGEEKDTGGASKDVHESGLTKIPLSSFSSVFSQRKDCLKRCVERYLRVGGRCAEAFRIIPKTFVLPKEYLQFVDRSEYIPNPMLIEGHKFDLRIFVLVTSFSPLEAFIYQEVGSLC